MHTTEGTGASSLNSLALPEKVPRVEGVISQEVPRRAVKIIRPSFGDYVDDSSRNTTELGAIIIGLDLEFLNVIDDRGVITARTRIALALISLPIIEPPERPDTRTG